MKYLPRRNLFFVHIPKCAGMSVRAALTIEGEPSFGPIAEDLGLDEEEAERVTERGNGFDHPRLGLIHPAHLPLASVKAQMPRTWEALLAARSFGLTRDPRRRFISALLQRLKEFKDAGAIRADDPIVREEAERVCSWLDGRDIFTDIAYAHFIRQSDFGDVDGKRILTALFPIERTDALSRWVEETSGLQIEIERSHLRRQPKRWARGVQPVVRMVGRHMMPVAVKRMLHPLWVGSGVFANAANIYEKVDLGTDVEAFIDRYYAVDRDLHDEAHAFANQWAPARAG